ncbi:MAG: hypothetical protein ACLT46_14260 [Hungatella sp.]
MGLSMGKDITVLSAVPAVTGRLWRNIMESATMRQRSSWHRLGVPVKEPVTYREKREADKRRRYKRELGQFVQEAVKWLTVYRGLLCEAVRERNEHFWEGLGNLTYVEYLLGCLKDCPEEVYADKKVVKEIGKVEGRVISWYI